MRIFLVAIMFSFDFSAAFGSGGQGPMSVADKEVYASDRNFVAGILGNRRRSKGCADAIPMVRAWPHVFAYTPDKGKNDVFANVVKILGYGKKGTEKTAVQRSTFSNLARSVWINDSERKQARNNLGPLVADQFEVYRIAKERDASAAAVALENLRKVPGDFLYRALEEKMVDSTCDRPLDQGLETFLSLLRDGRLTPDDMFWDAWVVGAENARFASALIGMNIVRATEPTTGGLRMISEKAQEHFEEKSDLFHFEGLKAEDEQDSEWIARYRRMLPLVREVAVARTEPSKDRKEFFPADVRVTIDALDEHRTQFFLRFDEVRRWGIDAAADPERRNWFASLIKKRPGLRVDLRTSTVGDGAHQRALLRTVFPSVKEADQKTARLWYYAHQVSEGGESILVPAVLQDILDSLPKPLDCSAEPVLSLMAADQVIESFRRALATYGDEIGHHGKSNLKPLAQSIRDTLDLLSCLKNPPSWIEGFVAHMGSELGGFADGILARIAKASDGSSAGEKAPASVAPESSSAAERPKDGPASNAAPAKPVERRSSLYDWETLNAMAGD